MNKIVNKYDSEWIILPIQKNCSTRAQGEGQPGIFLESHSTVSHTQEQNTREREKGAFYLAKSEAYWPAASRRPRRLMALKRTRDLEETGREIALPTNWMPFKRVGKLHLRTPGF